MGSNHTWYDENKPLTEGENRMLTAHRVCPPCFLCPLHKLRVKQVVGRGVVPADILFVGEAPGKTENLIGQPFVGRSGKLLDNAIAQAGALAGYIPTYYITNTVQCRPCDTRNGPNREPSQEEAWACRYNLETITSKVKPRAIVLMGKVAERHALTLFPSATKLQHPAYILRQGGVESPEFRRFVKDLEEVFTTLGKGV